MNYSLQIFRPMKKLFLLTLTAILLSSAYSQTWTLVPNGVIRPFYGCSFTDNTTGYLTGNYWSGDMWIPYVYKTIDGGNQLTILDLALGTSYLQSQNVYFIDQNKGFLAGGGIVITTDAGNFWNVVLDWSLVSGTLYDIRFFDAQNGIAVGESWYYDPLIFQTTDGGYNWNQLTITTESTTLNTVAFPGTDLIFVGATGTGASRTFTKSIDKGLNWTQPNFYNAIYSLCFTSVTTGFAGSDAGIFMTEDAGDTWGSVLTTPSKVNRIEIKNSFGFVVCEDGSIYNTINNGLSWEAMVSPVQGSKILYDVSVVSNNCAFASGSTGTLVQFTAPVSKINSVDQHSGNLTVSPNPILNDASINYCIDHKAITKIYICDISGRMIYETSSLNEEPGDYQINFNASDLKSGLYLTFLQIDGKIVNTVKLNKL
jgi:photosystem II stability/assembly factor-like uncharacterized protein